MWYLGSATITLSVGLVVRQKERRPPSRPTSRHKPLVVQFLRVKPLDNSIQRMLRVQRRILKFAEQEPEF